MKAERYPVRRARRGERGYALLMITLLGAFLAISLYLELPVAAFESKRMKEQLLMDRGHEYVQAIRLYYRRFHTFPASMDQLEDTNNMRFIRRRYKDPITGESEWRLLHVGPGGLLTDSKLDRTTAIIDSTGQIASTASDPANPDANAQDIPKSTADSPGGVPRRPPAIPADPESAPTPAAAPDASLVQTTHSDASNSGSSDSGHDDITIGAFAGVASRAHGETIKLVENQNDYSLWEFYYDPRKDPFAVMYRPNVGIPMNGAPGFNSTNPPAAPSSPTAPK
jgi:hypothetical protein